MSFIKSIIHINKGVRDIEIRRGGNGFNVFWWMLESLSEKYLIYKSDELVAGLAKCNAPNALTGGRGKCGYFG